MDFINKIQRCIIENDIELAYKNIIENENKLSNSAQFWNLKGMLYYKIREYDISINCYIKQIGFKMILSDESNNYAKYKKQNPIVIRIIAQKQ